MAKILIVDDEQMLREKLKDLLELEGHKVFTADGAENALTVFQEKNPQIVITDIRMPGMDGLALLDKIKGRSPDAEVLILTGHGDMDSAVQALKKNAFDYIPKPVNFDELIIALDRALISQNLRRDLVFQRAQLLRVQKMAIVGELNASVIYEVRQSLVAIGSQIQELVMNDFIVKDPILKEESAKIREIFIRMESVVRSVHISS
ncbi:MAG: sigma-54-dependent Fis family transcriptional regulator [Candidatus Omnitrophica bacterium]|nr:sigma-54-dependent Fis family transcriptional regulator [Candidatus Omnitrophota bacterium]